MTNLEFDGIPAEEFSAIIHEFARSNMTRLEFGTRVTDVAKKHFPNATPAQLRDMHEALAMITLKYLAMLNN